MNRTKRSVIPDAAVLVEEWERAAAGRCELEDLQDMPASPQSPRAGALLMLLSVLLLMLAGKWLCGC